MKHKQNNPFSICYEAHFSTIMCIVHNMVFPNDYTIVEACLWFLQRRSKYNVNKCGRVTIFMQLFIFFWQMVEKSWSVFHDNWILSRKPTIANIHSMWAFNLFKREINDISYNWINCFLSVIQVLEKKIKKTIDDKWYFFNFNLIFDIDLNNKSEWNMPTIHEFPLNYRNDVPTKFSRIKICYIIHH